MGLQYYLHLFKRPYLVHVTFKMLCDGLITRPDESYRMWRVVVCDLETSKTRRLKPATGLWKIQPRWVVTPGKQTDKIFKMIKVLE
jgi:hypothetical protein